MKLFLSSAGLRPEFKDDFLGLLGKDPKKCKVAFIATAADPEPNKAFVKWSTDHIEEAGMSWYEVDLKGNNADRLRKELAPADIIWVNGGNTFYLLDQARTSGFVNIVKELLQSGKIYYGVSAGSYLACPTIEAARWKRLDDRNVVNMTDFTSLCLVNFLMIAHYEKRWREAVENGVKSTDLPVAVLTDQQAVMVYDGKIKIIGSGEKQTYNGFEEII